MLEELKGIKVLILEDPIIAEEVAGILRDAGCIVNKAYTVDGAIDAFTLGPDHIPDIAFFEQKSLDEDARDGMRLSDAVTAFGTPHTFIVHVGSVPQIPEDFPPDPIIIEKPFKNKQVILEAAMKMLQEKSELGEE